MCVLFLPVLLGVQDVCRCTWRGAGLVSESPTTPSRCKMTAWLCLRGVSHSLPIRSRDSRSVMRRHRDVLLRGMGSYIRFGCSPPTLGGSGAIAATRFPNHFVLLDSCTSPPRPRQKERVSAHLELAIFSCLFPAAPSCIPAPSSLSFVLLAHEYSCTVYFPLSFFARTIIRPRPVYLAWSLVYPL